MSSIKINGSGSGGLRITGAGSAVVKIAPPAGGFDPGSLAGLVSWYKADAILGVANGGDVDSWLDSSTTGYTLTKASSGAASPIYSAADALLGGQPSVQFVRASGSALRYNITNSGSPLPMGNDPRTMYAVGYMTNPSAGAYQSAFGYGTNSNYTRFQLFQYSSGTGLLSMEFGSLASGGGIVSANTSFIAAFPYATNTQSCPFYLNGVSYPSTDPYANVLRTGEDGGGFSQIIIGSLAGVDPISEWGGAIAETLIYNTAHDGATRVLVQNYLATKYGISI